MVVGVHDDEALWLDLPVVGTEVFGGEEGVYGGGVLW